MMKKSLLALSVAAAAMGAQAADVQVYGLIDTSLSFVSSDADIAGHDRVNSFSMENAKEFGSRFGLKGSEDLGNGMKVSFQLENGFKADSGEFKTEGKLFDRQATVALSSDFGTLTMGRVGGIGSGAGFDIVYLTGDSFDGGCGDVLGLVQSARYDNMITYQTPKFAGLQATVQYSFNEDSVNDKDREGSSAVNRYASAALTGDFGALQTVLAYEFQNYQSYGEDKRGEDGHVVYLGGNYDCGFAKTFVMGQYFKGVQTSGVNALAMLDDLNVTKDVTYLDQADSDCDEGVKGYGLHLGTIVPIGNGDLTVGAYYVDGTGETSKATVEERDFDYMGLATKYEYRLSKRTSVYLAAAYSKTTVDATANHKEIEGQLTQVFTGLTHAF